MSSFVLLRIHWTRKLTFAEGRLPTYIFVYKCMENLQRDHINYKEQLTGIKKFNNFVLPFKACEWYVGKTVRAFSNPVK